MYKSETKHLSFFTCYTNCHTHRRMRRGGGQGGCSPPPNFWATQSFGQRQWWEGGVFQFSGGRADDVTRTMSKGGGVLVNVQESGGVFQFSGGRMTSRRQCQRGGGVFVKSPPSGNPVSAPVICVKFWAINPSAPPPPYAYGHTYGRPIFSKYHLFLAMLDKGRLWPMSQPSVLGTNRPIITKAVCDSQ